MITDEAREWSHHQEMKFSTVLYRRNRDIDFSLFQHLLSTPPMKILDLGCNGSYVAQKLCQMGYDAYGADLPAVVRQAQRDYPEASDRLLTCNLDTGEIPGNGYDLVLALGVIEHLVCYEGFFGKVARALRSGSIVFVSTCNRDAIETERHHYHHFSAGELEALAQGAQLETISIATPSRTSLIGAFRKLRVKA